MNQNKITLLDLVLQEPEEQQNHSQNEFFTHRNLPITTMNSPVPPINVTSPTNSYNQLGISLYFEANRNNSDKFLSTQLFKQVLGQIEDKLFEFEQRLANKEQLIHLGQQVEIAKYQLKPSALNSPRDITSQYENQFKRQDSQSSDFVEEVTSARNGHASTGTKFHKPTRSRSTYTNDQSNMAIPKSPKVPGEEAMQSRMNTFEKKLKHILEQTTKQIQKDDQFQRKIEQLVNTSIKDAEHSVQQSNKLQKECGLFIRDTSDNHKEILHRINQLKSDVENQSQSLVSIEESSQKGYYQLESTISVVSELTTQNNEQINQIKEWINQLENDLFTVLKCYKDLLLEQFTRSVSKSKHTES